MRKINKTYQKLLFLSVKLSIVAGSCYYIYSKINNEINVNNLYFVLINKFRTNFSLFIIILFMSVVNWFFEIIKWKTLVKTVTNISLKNSFIQTLSAHTSALITPNRIGEYGVKVLYFDKKLRKKITLLNLINHFLQMSVTVIFGLFGLIYLYNNYAVEIPIVRARKIIYLSAIVVAGIVSGKFFIPKKIRGIYFNKIVNFIRNIPKNILVKSFLLSVMRYLVFSTQFFIILSLFENNLNYYTILPLIYSVYLLASIIPGFPVFDWAIKGSVSIYVLSFAEINQVNIIVSTLIMWFLNFAIPAIIGSYYVLIFKFNKND